MGKIKDYRYLIGKTFDHLTVEEILLINNQSVAKCKCVCGNYKNAFPYQLKKGAIKSCGCKKAKFIGTFTKHHSRKTWNKIDNRGSHPLYGTWNQMIARCENPKSPYYHRYGKIGISVCEEWHDFNNFLKWSNSVGGRPDGYTLDRIDNSKGYSPENCRWASNYTQQRNKSTNVYITYNGETKVISDWSKDFDISLSTLRARYKKGLTGDELFEKPKRNRK